MENHMPEVMRKEFKGIPVTEVHSADGASVLVADHGAHLLAWAPPGAGNVLYLSETSQYGGGTAIRGGVPIIFPQFGERGTGKRHGFVRNQAWTPVFAGVEDGRGVLRFTLDAEAASWPYRYRLDYEIVFDAGELRLGLAVANVSESDWEFCAALHTYFGVAAIADVTLEGLQGLTYLDQPAGGVLRTEEQALVRIDGEVDRVYGNATRALLLRGGGNALCIGKEGFADVVVWNPGGEKAAGLADVAAGDAARFLCVEAGAILQPVRLAAGATWRGAQVVTLVE